MKSAYKHVTKRRYVFLLMTINSNTDILHGTDIDMMQKQTGNPDDSSESKAGIPQTAESFTFTIDICNDSPRDGQE